MEALEQADMQSLEWKQLDIGGRVYELYSVRGVVARLNWRDNPRALTTAETADGDLAFKRESYTGSPRVSILAGSQEESGVPEWAEVGTYRSERGGRGVLQLAGGREYLWKRSGRWRSGGTFTMADGAPVIQLTWRPGAFRAGSLVEVPGAPALPSGDLLLLIIAGWYLMRLKASDDAIAAGAAAAAIAATSV
jgi:hypothetical protein